MDYSYLSRTLISGLGATIALVTNDITCPALLNSRSTEQLAETQNSLNILVTLL